MTHVIQTPQKPEKKFSVILKRCFGTEFSHRLFNPKDPDAPRLSLHSICPNCGIHLYEWSEAVYKSTVQAIPRLPSRTVNVMRTIMGAISTKKVIPISRTRLSE